MDKIGDLWLFSAKFQGAFIGVIPFLAVNWIKKYDFKKKIKKTLATYATDMVWFFPRIGSFARGPFLMDKTGRQTAWAGGFFLRLLAWRNSPPLAAASARAERSGGRRSIK